MDNLQEAYLSVYQESLEEGMTLKDYKRKKSAQKQKFKREMEKTSPTRRKDIHKPEYSPERASRHRANVDPDFDGNDEDQYPGGALKNPKKIRKAKALGELGENLDLFDEILEYLVTEGYADTNENALVIMANMSLEWRNSIVENLH